MTSWLRLAGLIGAFALSLAPYTVLTTVLGPVDLVYFIVVWFLFFFVRRVFSSSPIAALIAAIAAGLALSLPPVPNYLAFSPNEELRIWFIGWHRIVDGGFVFLLILYLISTCGVHVILRNHKQHRTTTGA